MNKFNIDVDPERDEYVITLRFKCNKNRFYVDESTGETYSEITGVIDTDNGVFGFAHTIDMDYKGKPDHFTEPIIRLEQVMEENDFIATCEEWSIPIAVV